MRVAIIGMGGVGSTFAHRLARNGHALTAVARGSRLAELERDGAIVTMEGDRAPVRVASELDSGIAWDLVLVTVLASQVGEVLPRIARSAARAVMFMFNTVESLAPLRDAVGAERFAFGFPSVVASVENGRLRSTVIRRGLTTTVSDAGWGRVFSEAGIPTVVHGDMESWLRSHAAFIVPFMTAAHLAHERHAGITWGEAERLAGGMAAGFRWVRALGHPVTPAAIRAVSHMPTQSLAAALWLASRTRALRGVGAAGSREVRALIDGMLALGGETEALSAMRP